MNYAEYQEKMKDVPVTEGLNYRPAWAWLHPERIPQAVHSLPNRCFEMVIRIPSSVENKWGRRVPVVTVFRTAFRNNIYVTDILLPSGIAYLPDGAFAGCRNLRAITIPRKIRRIGPGTFDRCTALEDVYYEGTPEEWDRIDIVHEKHEIEFGRLVPGSPVEEVTAERRIHIPGNDALFTANIHFYCTPVEPAVEAFKVSMHRPV